MKPLAANSLLQNRYLIIHHIGKGGMGEVYLAVDQRLGNPVALKRTVFRDDDMMWDAFEREARILARLRHSVLPKVSDHFSEKEEQFLVMEYISGDDLAKRLEAAKKPFPLQWVLYWADELLDALSYLHTHEPPIIHRDIKPQNLKLTNENHVVLLDFGLAKNSVAKKTHISSSGSLVGYTPHYAPIEQIRGTGTSPRSDIYSLSATLYQLMTGTVPVDALTRAEGILGGGTDALPTPTEVVPTISNDISAVILKGMALNSEQRYADAKEMQKALREAYSTLKDVSEAEPFDGAETVISAGAGAAMPDASLSGKSEAYIFDTKDVERMFRNAQEPPVTLTAAEAAKAEPSADHWAHGETQGFTREEMRRTTIDEEAFQKLGFESEGEIARTENGTSCDAVIPPTLTAAAPMISPPAADTAFAGQPQAAAEAPAGQVTEEWSDLREKPTPIKPVTKPLDPSAKPRKKSSSLGMKLIGVAAVLCFLVAGAGAVGWYAVNEKLITLPGFEAAKPPVVEETKTNNADITTSNESFTEAGNSAPVNGAKDATGLNGTSEAGLTTVNPGFNSNSAEREGGDKKAVKTTPGAPKTGKQQDKPKPKAQPDRIGIIQ